MAISSSPIQQVTATDITAGTATVVATITAPTAGNTLIAIIAINDEVQTVTSVTGGGCTWSRAVQNTGNATGHHTTEIWVGENSSGAGTTVTVTVSTTGLTRLLNVTEWSGLPLLRPAKNRAIANGSSVSPLSGTVDIADIYETLYITGIAITNDPTPSAGPTNSFTALATATASAQGLRNAYRVVTGAGSYSTGYTVATNNWSGAIASFGLLPITNINVLKLRG